MRSQDEHIRGQDERVRSQDERLRGQELGSPDVLKRLAEVEFLSSLPPLFEALAQIRFVFSGNERSVRYVLPQIEAKMLPPLSEDTSIGRIEFHSLIIS